MEKIKLVHSQETLRLADLKIKALRAPTGSKDAAFLDVTRCLHGMIDLTRL